MLLPSLLPLRAVPQLYSPETEGDDEIVLSASSLELVFGTAKNQTAAWLGTFLSMFLLAAALGNKMDEKPTQSDFTKL